MKNYLTNIRDQYERYPFPVRPPEQELERLIVSELDHLSKIDHHCFAGQRNFDEPFRVLVAGGGTGDALIFLAEQLRGKPAEFLFVDMSRASLDVAQARAATRGITNVTWKHGSLLDLDPTDVGTFDYINCVGVLHHLADPMEGLARLEGVLAPQGGMGLMLYGKYGRRRTYLIQELLGLIDGGNPDLEGRLGTARETLSDLIRGGVIGANEEALQLVEDPASSSYLVDTYLHGQDRAYSVSDIHELLASSDLQLAGFTNFFESQGATCALEYDSLLFFKGARQLERVAALPEQKRAHIAEILGRSISMHAFYVTRQGQPRTVQPVLDHAPMFCTGYARSAIKAMTDGAAETVSILLNCGVSRTLDMTEPARVLLAFVGSGATTAQITEHVQQVIPGLDAVAAQTFSKSLLDLLIRLGLVTMRDPALPGLPVHPSARVWNGSIDLRPFGQG